MRVCVIGKYPPIEGGVSAQTYWTAHLLARAGHEVFVVTNADEVEPEHRECLLPGDAGRLEADYPDGGSVRVSFTQPRHDDDLYYIPRNRPTVTRLASVAAELVRRHDCEVLIGWYLEPYVIATSLVAAWTGRPFLIRHAGSDLYDLAAQPELGPAYREVIRAASGVLSSVLPAEGLGVPAERVFGFPGPFLPAEFSATGTAMDLVETARTLHERPAPRSVRAGTVLIGAYGKLGVSKGTVDLVRAVARVRAAGHPVGLALLGGGRGWPAVIEAVDAAGIAEVTVMLPMLAPWHIPSFIRSCRAMAFLERDFEVAGHRPVVPLEILACGRPVLLSSQLASTVLPGRPADDPLFDAVELVDPRDPDALAEAVISVLARTGPTAAALAASLRDEAEVARWYASVFERVLGRRPASGASAAERSEVERVLARYSPALVHALGPRLAERHPADVRGASNALLAAYAVTDACLPEVRAMIRGRDGRMRRLAQLALAEHHALWTRVDVESRRGVPAFPVPVQRVPRLEGFDELRPVASNWLRVAEFDVDAFAHLEAVTSGHATALPGDGADPAGGPRQVLLFHKAPNLTHTVSRIGGAVRALLEAADGTRSLRELAATLGARDVRLSGLLRSVGELHRVGVLSFRRDLGG